MIWFLPRFMIFKAAEGDLLPRYKMNSKAEVAQSQTTSVEESAHQCLTVVVKFHFKRRHSLISFIRSKRPFNIFSVK
jgi:hypothetical protein